MLLLLQFISKVCMNVIRFWDARPGLYLLIIFYINLHTAALSLHVQRLSVELCSKHMKKFWPQPGN